MMVFDDDFYSTPPTPPTGHRPPTPPSPLPKQFPPDESKFISRQVKGLLSNWLPYSPFAAFRPPTPPNASSARRTPSPTTVPGSPRKLLRPLGIAGKKTIVLDLDETLVHSTFQYVPDADLTLDVEIDGVLQTVYVLKRPGLDKFMEALKDLDFEVVIFTASLPKYANAVIDEIDQLGIVSARLFRESCTNVAGNLVKDMSRLGRDLKSVVIVDNSPVSYSLQPHNAIPVATFMDDKKDTELPQLLPLLNELAKCSDVAETLRRLLPGAKPPSPMHWQELQQQLSS